MIDLTAPNTTIDSGPAGPTNDTTPTFTFSSSESGSTFKCQIDSGAISDCTSPFTAAALAAGPHTLSVRATDAAGNTDATPATQAFSVDLTAPNTTIDTGPTGATNDNTPTFGFSSTEAGTFECRVDAAAFATCTTPFTAAALSDGAHTFDVRAIDTAGNVDATPATRTITVDTAAPNTTIDTAPTSPSNDNTATFAFSSSEAGSSFECRVDTAAFASCTTPFTTAALSDGTHTFEVRATDPAGNTDGTPAGRTLVIDTAAPSTTIDSAPTSPSNDNTATFAFSSPDATATFQCRVDGGTYGTCASPFTTAALNDASHTIDIRAIDPAGNIGAAASRTLVIDTAGPVTTINTGPSGATNDTTPTWAFSANEAGVTFACRVDTGSFTVCSSPLTLSALNQGPHTFDVRATDAAGNVGAVASRSITVDTDAPQTTIDSATSSPTNDTTPTFTFSSSEPAGATFECRVDAAAFAPCTSPFTTVALTPGSHTFEIRAIDAAGNTDGTPATRTILIDTTAPETTIDSGPSGPTNITTPAYTFSSEAGATFQCRVDGAAFAACTSPFSPTLGQGPHTVEVRAIDTAGNVDPTPASRSLTVDTTAPVAPTITGAPAALGNNTTPAFTFTGEAGATFQCRIDGGSYSTCGSPFTPTLGQGSHTVDIRAVDAALNAGPAASRTFVIDTTAPTTTITDGPNDPGNDTTPTFTFDADETSTFQCRIDAAAFASCASPFTAAALGQGSHTFQVRATDQAGNQGAAVSRTFVIDTTAPTATIDSGPPTATNDTTPTFTFSSEADATFECRMDSAVFSPCDTPFTSPELAGGSHTFQVRATDTAGNTGTAASRTFTVDTTTPETTITSGPDGPTNDTTPTWAFGSSKTPSTFECRIDGASFASCTSPFTAPALSAGNHTFEVRAIDSANNPDGTPASRTIFVDTTAPNAPSISTPAQNARIASSSVTFTGIADPGDTVELLEGATVRGSGVATGGAWSIVLSIADGAHTYTARSTDPAGNVGPAGAGRTITVDTTAPDTTISGTDGAVTTATPQFTLSSTEAGSTFQCRVDAAAFTACTSPYTTPALTEGTHTIDVRAIDQAGNVDATPDRRSVTVDTIAPNTDAQRPQRPDRRQLAAVHLHEHGDRLELRVQPRCRRVLLVHVAADAHEPRRRRAHVPRPREGHRGQRGRHTGVEQLHGRHGARRRRPSTAAPPAPTNDNTPTLAFSANEAATFQCRIDNGPFTRLRLALHAAALSDGPHTFEVRAKDAAGNQDATPASQIVTVDTTAPDAPVITAPTREPAARQPRRVTRPRHRRGRARP